MSECILLSSTFNNNFCSRRLLKLFTDSQLIKWSGLCESYEAGLRGGQPGAAPAHIFAKDNDKGEARWGDMRSRVVEHVS